MKNLQKGLSLIEVLFSLAITGVILTIIVNYYYSQNKVYLNVSKAATQIQHLANVSYEWQAAQNQTDFTGISISTLQKAGLLSALDNYSQIDPWGGVISLSVDSSNASYVLITLPQIPQDACNNLRSRMASTAHSQASSSECSTGSYYISI